MAKNPNDHNVDSTAQLKRSTYDLSHSLHLSGKIGKLYPVTIQELVPGDSGTISNEFYLRFAPTPLPLTTKAKFVIDYFFVPLQALWEDQRAFFTQGMNESVAPPEHPFLSFPGGSSASVSRERMERMLGTGSIGDYLGVPTVIPHKTNAWRNFKLRNQRNSSFLGNKYLHVNANTIETIVKELNTSALDYEGDRLRVVFREFLSSSDRVHTDSEGTHFNDTVLVGAPSFPVPSGMQFDTASSIKFQFFGGSQVYSPTKPLIVCLHRTTRNLRDADRLYLAQNGRESIEGSVMSSKCVGDCLAFSVGASAIDYIGATMEDTNHGNFELTLPSSRTVEVNDFMRRAKMEGSQVYWSFWTPYLATEVINGDSSTIGHFTPDFGYFSMETKLLGHTMYGANASVATASDASSKGAGRLPSPSLDPKTEITGNVASSVARVGQPTTLFASDLINYLGVSVSMSDSQYTMASDIDALYSAFGGISPAIPLNALLWRAPECVYNFWYRNHDLDPLRENDLGQPVLTGGHRVTDRFLTRSQMGNGADTNVYELHNALLEKDMFTSCLTEPLINYNPLIGIRQKKNGYFYDFATSGGVVTIGSDSSFGFNATESSNGSPSNYVVLASGYQGQPIGGVSSPVQTASVVTSYGSSIPEGDLSVMKDIIYTGITTADIHSAECLKRWISNKVQNGYNFSEQQMAQFGINSRWNPLTSPIYLGGVSEWVNNGVITNTAKSSDAALGELGGLPTCISSKESSIHFKATERGFLIGMMRVVPIPVYAQAMNGVFSVHDYTDYFIPEFANKGWEKVPLKELAPLQAVASSPSALHNAPFGYNVPWHRYKSAVDRIAGDMRVNFNDSVYMRDFATLPQLGKDFIECNSEDYDNVFVDTSQQDKFIGEIFNKIKISRPIPNYQDRTI